jgi:hypothetical protein
VHSSLIFTRTYRSKNISEKGFVTVNQQVAMRNERAALSDNSSAALVSMLLVQYLLKEPFLVVCNSATRRYCIVLMEYCKKVDNLP